MPKKTRTEYHQQSKKSKKKFQYKECKLGMYKSFVLS